MSTTVLFVAPDGAERTFRRVADGLPETRQRAFHSMLLSQPTTDLRRWSIAQEVEAIAQKAGQLGRVDLVGYSGGAAMCLAFLGAGGVAANVTLIEPPWIGNDVWSDDEALFTSRFDGLMAKDDASLVNGFFALFAPGFAPPTPDAEVARMAGPLRAVWRGYRETALDRDCLTQVSGGLSLPFGEASSPRMLKQAHLLAEVSIRSRVMAIPGAHHFNITVKAAGDIAASIEALALTAD
jgi:pimeloyl-ACP methyl ester carboxylesterase